MSTGLSMQLHLADPGWLLIDDAAVHVSGTLDVIVREMEAVLNDDAVRVLCSKLGILSAGFYFIDPIKKNTRFFQNDPRSQPQTYRTEYLWSDQDAGRRWSELVHRLFVQVRSIQGQQNAGGTARSEDFFRYIPKDKQSGYSMGQADQQIRSRYAIHYVTLGEMIFTMLAWRSLVAAMQMGHASCRLEQINVGLLDEYDSPPCTWCGIDLVDGGQMPDQMRAAWKVLSNETPHLASVWEKLDVRFDLVGTPSTNGHAAMQFIASLLSADSVTAIRPTSETVNAMLQRAIPVFLKRLGVKNFPATIGEALDVVERYARFPILPFYVWYALDRAPKCYLVTPVWTSQQYSVEVDDAQSPRCRHLGLALSAVLPLRRIDWTLPQPAIAESECRSEADPVVIANVIRLMARPLVEEHLYSSLLREIKARNMAAYEAIVKNAMECNDGQTE